MGVELAIIRAKGILISAADVRGCNDTFQQYRGFDADFLKFDQTEYGWRQGKVLYCHYCDEDVLFDQKIGGTPFSFMDGGPYPEKATNSLLGGACLPFVVIEDWYDIKKWQHMELLTEQNKQLADILSEKGACVQCLFSYFH